jgi:hypothetical protein
VQGLLNLLKGSDPALAKTVRIQAIPLSRALMFAEAQKANKKPVKVDVVPHRQSLEYALTVAQQSNKDLKKFPGVPVFALTDLKGQKVISVKRKDSDQPSQIYFFDEVDAQTAFTSLKSKNPQLAAQTRISAAPFQNLLAALFKMQKPAEADRIILYPSTAALKYAQTLAPKPKKS